MIFLSRSKSRFWKPGYMQIDNFWHYSGVPGHSGGEVLSFVPRAKTIKIALLFRFNSLGRIKELPVPGGLLRVSITTPAGVRGGSERR